MKPGQTATLHYNGAKATCYAAVAGPRTLVLSLANAKLEITFLKDYLGFTDPALELPACIVETQPVSHPGRSQHLKQTHTVEFPGGSEIPAHIRERPLTTEEQMLLRKLGAPVQAISCHAQVASTRQPGPSAPSLARAGQGIICRTERTTLIATRRSAARASPPPEPPEPDEHLRRIAAKVFELLTALDPDNRLRKAPPIKVFNLYYRQRLEPAEIARICKCHRSLIFNRLAAIQDRLPWTPQQLCELSPQVEAMQDALTDSRARAIHRKSSVYGSEDGEGESD